MDENANEIQRDMDDNSLSNFMERFKAFHY